MSGDPLETLLRMRRLAVDEARRELGACLRAEGEAAQTVAAIEAAIRRETAVATSLATGDAEVEAFAAWLRRIRPRQRAALAAEEAAEAGAVQARAVLGAARAAVRATEQMLEKRAVAMEADAQRQAQREIDEVAGRSKHADGTVTCAESGIDLPGRALS
jgi:flagellar export protein FliJ